MMTGFPFAEEFEEGLLQSLDPEQSVEILIPMLENLDKVKKTAAKTAKKKGKEPTVSGTPDEPETSGEPVEQSDIIPAEEWADELGDTLDIKGESSTTPAPVKCKAVDKPSDSDGDKNPSRRISSQDKQRTPRNPDKDSSSKLFKMDPPRKYVGEKDSERTYQAAHMFLSQHSRYLRLATNVDVDKQS
jgi:hypothetical protein